MQPPREIVFEKMPVDNVVRKLESAGCSVRVYESFSGDATAVGVNVTYDGISPYSIAFIVESEDAKRFAYIPSVHHTTLGDRLRSLFAPVLGIVSLILPENNSDPSDEMMRMNQASSYIEAELMADDLFVSHGCYEGKLYI